MKFDEIQESWSQDCQIDVLNITGQSSETPKLHHKYLVMLMEAKAALRKGHTRLTKFKKLKFEYFSGTMAREEMQALGWEPFQLKILKSDMNKYIENDNEVINLTSLVGEAQEIVFYLEEILRQINSRGFQIQSIIKWEMFQAGN